MSGGVGWRLRKRREALNLSQRELARRIGVRQATISDLERGLFKNPGINIIRRIAQTLGVTTDYLIGMYSEDSGDAPSIPQVFPDDRESKIELTFRA